MKLYIKNTVRFHTFLSSIVIFCVLLKYPLDRSIQGPLSLTGCDKKKNSCQNKDLNLPVSLNEIILDYHVSKLFMLPDFSMHK
jgi:hypothetical protein